MRLLSNILLFALCHIYAGHIKVILHIIIEPFIGRENVKQ